MTRRTITFMGKTMTISEWAKECGLTYAQIHNRLKKYGDASQEAMEKVLSPAREINRSNARFLTYNGETHSIKDWAKIVGMSYGQLQHRLLRGYSLRDALQAEPRFGKGGYRRLHGGRRVTIDGVEDNVAGHARRLGLSLHTLRDRMSRKYGLSAEEALGKPIKSREECLLTMRAARSEARARRQLAQMGVVI